jgi:ligand-binding SRPBCC domain-containing protein
MKVYSLQRTQLLPVSITEAWQFFSSPQNLSVITPGYMKFTVSGLSDDKSVQTCRIFRFRVKVFGLVTVSWVSQISNVDPPHCFVDEQLSGPFRHWRHSHSFREVGEGVEVTDNVEYALPFGIMGRLAAWLFVSRQLNSIFDYRVRVLAKYFTNQSVKQHRWISQQ